MVHARFTETMPRTILISTGCYTIVVVVAVFRSYSLDGLRCLVLLALVIAQWTKTAETQMAVGRISVYECPEVKKMI